MFIEELLKYGLLHVQYGASTLISRELLHVK